MRYLVRNLLLHLRDSEDEYCRLAFQLEKGYFVINRESIVIKSMLQNSYV